MLLRDRCAVVCFVFQVDTTTSNLPQPQLPDLIQKAARLPTVENRKGTWPPYAEVFLGSGPSHR